MYSDIFYNNLIISEDWLNDKSEDASVSFLEYGSAYFKVKGCPHGVIVHHDEKHETSDISQLLEIAHDISGDDCFSVSTDVLVGLSLDDFMKILELYTKLF